MFYLLKIEVRLSFWNTCNSFSTTIEAASHPHLKGTHSPYHTPISTPLSTPQRTPVGSPTGSPKASHKIWPFADKHAFGSESGYQNINVHEIVEQLSQSENLNEQADIIHYLYMKK